MSKISFFGTDGIRERVSSPLFSPESLQRLAYVVAGGLKKEPLLFHAFLPRQWKPRALERIPLGKDGMGPSLGDPRHTVLIGRDSRRSSHIIESALTVGFLQNGLHVLSLGLIPTPAVSLLTRQWGAALGVVISASHNPPTYNGIKFFSRSGLKMPERAEAYIARQYRAIRRVQTPLADYRTFGVLEDFPGETKPGDVYLEHLLARIGTPPDLRGLNIALDCANGSTSIVAPKFFQKLKATVHVFHHKPDGLNINAECGAVYPQALRAEVVRRRCDLGFSFDGDGDRLMVISKRGTIFDGDAILAVLARHGQERLRERSSPRSDRVKTAEGKRSTIVGTVQTNAFLEEYLGSLGFRLARAAVGDKFVLQSMLAEHALLGGESSGHVIHLDYSVTGDGLLTALLLCRALEDLGMPIDRALEEYRPYAQVTVNLEVPRKIPLEELPGFSDVLFQQETRLKKRGGRLVVRYSGTESLLRILVEGPSKSLLQQIAQTLSVYLRRALKD